MFFKLIDEYTIQKAPNPLNIDGNDVFTNSEKTHNEQGYYKVINTPYPNDEEAYRPIYAMSNDVILQEWEKVERNEE